MVKKAPIYTSKDKAVETDLVSRLHDAVDELIQSLKPNVPINNGSRGVVGFGINKANKAIAADAVVSIVRQIKGKPGW